MVDSIAHSRFHTFNNNEEDVIDTARVSNHPAKKSITNDAFDKFNQKKGCLFIKSQKVEGPEKAPKHRRN